MENVLVHTDKGSFTSLHVFKSFLDTVIDKEKNLYVDQHFKGWFVETEVDSFEENRCTFMDFRIEQKDEIRFMYVLPFHKRKALIELAIFSNKILTQEAYDEVISTYIKDVLSIEKFQIVETEFGIIPMTTYDFSKHDSARITHIGTMAGAVKASTGFAFLRIQNHLDEVINCIKNGEHPRKAKAIFKKKHKIYDATMLNVLLNEGGSGAAFFYDLFVKNPAQRVFHFLDEKASLLEEVKLMNTTDRLVFGKSFFKQLLRKG